MKTPHLFLITALCLTTLASCREGEDFDGRPATAASVEAASSSYNDPKDPPKDKPRDRDNWKPAPNLSQ